MSWRNIVAQYANIYATIMSEAEERPKLFVFVADAPHQLSEVLKIFLK